MTFITLFSAYTKFGFQRKGRLKPPVNVNGLQWGIDGRLISKFRVTGKFFVYTERSYNFGLLRHWATHLLTAQLRAWL